MKTRRIDPLLRTAIYLRDNFTCAWCQLLCMAELVDRAPTLDHIDLHSTGGSNKSENLITACHGCNYARGNMGFNEWCEKKLIHPRIVLWQASKPLNTMLAKRLLNRYGSPTGVCKAKQRGAVQSVGPNSCVSKKRKKRSTALLSFLGKKSGGAA